MQGKRILVIDDDHHILCMLSLALSRQGAQVFTAADGTEGLAQFYAHQPELVILDVMLPGVDGLTMCARLRQISQVPIMLLTALNSNSDMVRGLACGADDYVVKPFTVEVLVARVEALLRRAALPPSEGPCAYYDDYLSIDLDKRRILVRGVPVSLTSKEYQLLSCLLRNTGRVLSVDELLEEIWGWEYRGHVQYLYVHMCNLRKKLEADPRRPRYLRNECNLGYWFEVPDGD